MANTTLERIGGNNGSILLAAGEQTINVASIVIQEDDTDVSSIFEKEVDRTVGSGTYGQLVDVDVRDEQNPDGTLYKKGAILVPRRGYFSKFTFDKQVMGYRILGPKAITGE